MPYRLDRMIGLAALTMVIGAAPALAHGSGSHSSLVMALQPLPTGPASAIWWGFSVSVWLA